MSNSKNVRFVLDNLPDYQTLAQTTEDSEVYVLDAKGDVLSQMANILKAYSNLDAIHLFSHGSSGSLNLGSLMLSNANLADYATVLSQIGASLSENGDLLLYGCNVANGTTGVEFISKLSQMTGADIAASDNLTGAADKGGDWVLEIQSGEIQAASFALADYASVLGSYNYSDSNDHQLDLDDEQDTDSDVSIEHTGTGTVTVINFFSDGTLTVTGSGNVIVDNPFADGTTLSNEGIGMLTLTNISNGGTLRLGSNGPVTIIATESDEGFSINNAGNRNLTLINNSESGTVTVNGVTGGTITNTGTGNGTTYISNPTGDLTVNNTGANNLTFTNLDATTSAVQMTNTGTGRIDVEGGNLTLTSNDIVTLTLNDNDTIAMNVNNGGFGGGTVSLGDAQLTLSLASDYTPVEGDTITLIDNDLADAVTGTFAGKPQGSTIQVDSYLFTISYTGGTGNDVVLTMTGHGNTPPVITGLDGDSVTLAANEVGIIDADQMPNFAWVTDSDSANFNDGYLLIHQATGTTDGNFSVIDSLVLFNASDAGLDDNNTPLSASGAPAYGNDVYVMTMDDGWVKIGVVDEFDQLDGQGGRDLRIDLNASAMPNHISTILQTLQYSSDTVGTRTFEATVSDNGTDLSNVATFTVVIGAEASSNDALVITGLDGDSVSWAGVGNTVKLDASSNATVADTTNDAENWNGVTLNVQRSGTAVTSDVLGISNGSDYTVSGGNLQAGGNTFATFTSANGVLAITFANSGADATNALVQDVLRNVTYRNDTPAGNATLQFTLAEGDASTTADVTVTSDKIYVTTATDTADNNLNDGVSFSEALRIANTQTGTDTVVLSSTLVNETIGATNVSTLSEDVIVSAGSIQNATISGGSLDTNGHTLTLSNVLTTVETLVNDNYIDVADKLNIGTAITGTGSLIKSGTGSVTLSGANNYSGGTTLTNGTLEAASTNLGSGNISFASTQADAPATLFLTNASGTSTNFTKTIALTTANGGVIEVPGDAGIFITTLSGDISGTADGDLILRSAGGSDDAQRPTIKLSGNNTFNGKTIIDMKRVEGWNGFGDVSIAGDGNLGTGALQIDSGDLTITDNTAIDNAVILNSSSYLTIGSNKSVTFSGNMNGVGGFYIESLGTNSNVTFTGTNTNNEGVSVGSNVTLTLNDANGLSAIADTAGLLMSGGTVILNQDSETIGFLDSNSTLNIGGNTLTIAGSNTSVFGGTLVGSGNLFIQGSSSNANSLTVNSSMGSMSGFSGTTTVNSHGKLAVNNYLGGDIVVESTGLLSGSGIVLGTVTVENGGTLGAGSLASYATTVEDIDLNGGLTAESGSTLHFTLNGATARTGYDQLKVLGAVNVSGATLTLAGSYTPIAGNVFTLITNDEEDAVTGTFEGLAEGATVTFNGVDMILSYIGGDGNDITLTAPAATLANTVPDAQTTDEDTKKTITGLSVTSNDTVTVTLSVDKGVIHLANINTAEDITVLDANGLDGTIRFSGMATAINAMLENGVDYYPKTNENGNGYATLTMTTTDGTDTDIDTASINVTAVNDAPTFNITYSAFLNNYFADEEYEGDSFFSESYASALQPDGKFVMVGYATSNDSNKLAIMRINRDGTLDTTFGNSGTLFDVNFSGAESVAIQPDGKILIGGYDSNFDVYIARLNSDGSPDDTFSGSSGTAYVTDDTDLDIDISKLLLQPDGKIVMVGGVDATDMVIVRYDALGELDTSFNTTGFHVVNFGDGLNSSGDAVAIDADGKIVVGGSVAGNDDNFDFALVRLNTNGTLDTTFGTGGKVTLDIGGDDDITAIAIQSDGKIVVVGTTNATDDGDYDIALARFNADGTVDTGFGTAGKVIVSGIHAALLDEYGATNGDDIANAVAIDKDGNIYVGGGFNYNNADDEVDAMFPALLKFNSNGVLDDTIGTNGFYIPKYVAEGYIDDGDAETYSSVIIQPDGNVLATGSYAYIDYSDDVSSSFFAVRLDPDTLEPSDPQFGTPIDLDGYAKSYDFEESGDPVIIGDKALSPKIFDVEQHAADNYVGGTLTIHRTGGANVEDVIRFDDSYSSAMTSAGITLEGTSATTGNIKYSNSTFATYNTTTNGQLVVNFTSSQTDATQTLVDAVTASITYRNTNNINPGLEDLEVVLDWTYNDGNGGEVTSTTTIGIDPIDDTQTGGDGQSIDEDYTSTVTVTRDGQTLTAVALLHDRDNVTTDNTTGEAEVNSYYWQVKVDDEWILIYDGMSIDGDETTITVNDAYSAEFVIPDALANLPIRSAVYYYDMQGFEYYAYSDEAEGGGEGGGGSGTLGNIDSQSDGHSKSTTWGQSFTANATGLMQTIKVISATASDTQWSMIIHEGDGTTGTILHSQTGDAMSEGVNVLTIDSELTLQSGSVYTIYFSSAEDLQYTTSSTYPDGNVHWSGVALPTWDLLFEVTIGEDGNNDATSPEFVSAATSADGTKVILTYDEELSETTALAAAFAITTGGSANTVTNVTIDGSTVVLTLTNAVTSGQAVTVAYTDPTDGDDVNAIQDDAGNDAVTLASTTVTNSVPAPISGGIDGGSTTTTTPVTTPIVTQIVDGATVQTTTTTQTRTTTDTSGNTTTTTVSAEQLTIAPITSTSSTATANVPLFWGESTRTEWATTASLPIGVGLSTEGSRAPAEVQTIQTALADLIYYIDTTTPNTDLGKVGMLNGGATFLSALGNIDTLIVNKVTLTSTDTTASATPITITGTANTIVTTAGSIAPVEALVIDAQTLPSNSTLQLQNVEFAVIIGENLTIRGGEGKNILYTGAGHQNIMLGEDDDELYAGDGDDTVGSAGGNDKIFGEAGNDTIFALEGSNLLHGGSGNDKATYLGNMADYVITRDEGKTYVALISNPDEIDTLINVETVEFADSTYTIENSITLNKIATLYMQVLNRQAEIDGFQYWVKDTISLGNMGINFIKSDEYKASSGVNWETLDVSAKVEQFYEAFLGRSSDADGKAYWVDAINAGMTLEQAAEGFIESIEMQGIYQAKVDWNFFV